MNKITLTLSTFLFITICAQNDPIFEFYEYSDGRLRAINYPATTTQRYQNNVFLNDQIEKMNENSATMALPSCEAYSSIKRDLYGGVWGQLAIPHPMDKSMSILRVVLSIAARLPSVSNRTTFIKRNSWVDLKTCLEFHFKLKPEISV